MEEAEGDSIAIESAETPSRHASEAWIIWVSSLYFAFAWIITILLERPAPSLTPPKVMTFVYGFLLIGGFSILILALRPLRRLSMMEDSDIPLAEELRRLSWGALQGLFLLLFLSTFSSAVKSSMSVVADFSWDEPLAELDAAVHLGRDAWQLYLPIAERLPLRALEILYMPVWLLHSAILPLAVLLLERDRLERRRYFICFFTVWIVIGNIVALAFLSGGPIYFAELTGGDRFYPLIDWLNHHAADIQMTILVQEALWESQMGNAPFVGAGISAFPSVHVAMATLTMLYCGRRFGQVGLAVGLSYLIMIQLGSVVFAWHYAIDGYFSIIMIVIAWRIATPAAFASRRRAPAE